MNRTHYAMIPKIAMIELNPYELALYCNYTQTCGKNGVCTKSNATLAEETGMSIRQIQRMRKALAEKGYIQILSTGNESPPRIKVLESVWDKNSQAYTTPTHDSQSHPMTDSHTPHDSQSLGGDSQSYKEEPNNNNQIKEEKDISPKKSDEPIKNKQTDELKNYVAANYFGYSRPAMVTTSVWKRITKCLKQILEVHDKYQTLCTTSHLARFLEWYRLEKPGWDLPINNGMGTHYLKFYDEQKSKQQPTSHNQPADPTKSWRELVNEPSQPSAETPTQPIANWREALAEGATS